MIRIPSDVSLLSSSSSSVLFSPPFSVYRRRFYVLFVFGFLAFNQCLFWLTFSPISQNVQAYYNVTESTVNLLLNWGPIVFIPYLPIVYVLLNRHNGLRRCVQILAVTDLVAVLLRVLPEIFLSHSDEYFTSISLLFIHIGQILNATCGPLVMAPVSQLSSIWFGQNERTRATTVAIVSGSFGSTIGFLISPWIVDTPESIPRLLFIHLILAAIPCVLVLMYFPARPPYPPSAAAQILLYNLDNTRSGSLVKDYIKSLRQCLSTPSFILLCAVGGLLSGAFAAWTSLFANILAPENFTEKEAGWFGFGGSLAAIFGGLFTSTLADMKSFRRSFKSIIIVNLAGCVLALVWFNLSVRTIFYDQPVLIPSVSTITLSVVLVGFFQGSTVPLIYEVLAEITFPLPESLSASVLVQFCNITALILLLIPPTLYQLMNFLVVLAISNCIVMMAFVHIDYKRLNEDERKQ